jgi:peptidoglycan/xylan/chitin deacetylase (PgdA/CDA1 family)
MLMSDVKQPLDRSELPAHVESLHPSAGAMLKNFGMRLAGRAAVAFDRALGSRAGEALGIVTYHRVAETVPGLPAPLCNVTPARFREHLTTLLQAGFRFLPLTKVLELRSRGELPPPRSVVLTFDDGFEGVYRHAWPVMRELGVPGTIFVSTGFLDQDQPFPFDAWGLAYERVAPLESFRPLATWQCHEMLAGGLVDIGAHTHVHADLRGRPAEFRDDVQRSVEYVRDHFQREQVTFAYPFGSPRLGFAGGDLVAAVKQTDAVCALTTECELVDTRTDPFCWGRLNAFSWDTGRTLEAKLGGWYGWAVQSYRYCARLAPSRARAEARAEEALVSAEVGPE